MLLLAQNHLYTKIKPTIEMLILFLNKFHEESVKAVEQRIDFFEKSLATIEMFSSSHQLLERIGLPDLIIAQVESNNQPEAEVFEKSREHMEITRSLERAMRDTLMCLLQ